MVMRTEALDLHEQGKTFTYADIIINYLLQIDVEYVFGVPGGAIEPLFNALAHNLNSPNNDHRMQSSNNVIPLRKRARTQRITPIVARHESGAAFMAEGYARETGRLGVCCSTTGPGATNLITGVATAYANRTPMLVLTPQTALPNFGKRGLQESSGDAIDIVGMFEHCTRYNSLVSHHSQLEGKLYTALVHAFRKPCGPVHLSIPMDILKTQVDNYTNTFQVAHLFRQPKILEVGAYESLTKILDRSNKNVLFIGSGARFAIDAIVSYAEKKAMPIITTPSGKSLVNAYHPLNRGVFGFAGHTSASEILVDETVDHIIAVGTSLSELSTAGWDDAILNNRLVHVSDFAEDFLHSPMACLHVLGDPKTIFANLCKDFLMAADFRGSSAQNISMRTGNSPGSNDYVPDNLSVTRKEHLYSDAVPLKPQRVMYELANRLPADSRFIIDAGNAWSWATHYLMLDSTLNQRADFGFGAMGWGIGAAVGTAFGCSDKQVVCITGDGSFLMNGQELTVAVANKLSMLFVVLNDQALGMVKHGQKLAGAEEIGYQLPPVDFAMMARAQGAQAYTIRSPKDFENICAEQISRAEGPTLLDMHIDPEEVPLMRTRIKTLNNN